MTARLLSALWWCERHADALCLAILPAVWLLVLSNVR
jgi:hypothetical protein